MSLHAAEPDAAEFDHDHEQEDDVTTSPEHADEYNYEPLPGDRWIRVLILEPAPELDCPFVARLELLTLGPALPTAPKQQRRYEAEGEHKHKTISEPPEDEKQQHEAYVSLVNARRLPYTALSYSWAMDNGDDSRSWVLTLHGKQVTITQNLSEGLRRIRLKTDSQRLWVDALCIDQQNTTERSAQVAMMADIFNIATRCIVWLGEGPTKKSDLAVWQLSHCISPDIDTGAIRMYADYQLEIAAIVLNAMMAVDKSRCTVNGCDCHHPRLDTGDFADNSLIRFIRGRYADTSPRLHYKLYLRFMLRSRPKTIKRKLSMIEEWLGRRYWQRRWIVQENASRNTWSGATDYCWGEFSMSRKRLRDMLRMLSILRDSFDILFGHRFDVAFIEGPLAVMQSGTEGGKDLCDHLTIHETLRCSDARDRLYSLVTLDPDYGVHVDYTLPIREVCIEFSKLMVRRGDCLRLLQTVAHNRSHEGGATSLDLPSWAFDLRLASHFVRKFEIGRTCNAVVDASLQLSLELIPVGLLVNMEQDIHNPRKRYLVMEPHGIRLKTGRDYLRKQSNPTRPKLFLGVRGKHSCKKGDVLYADDDGRHFDHLLWLRPVNDEPPLQHRIIDMFHFFQLQSSTFGDAQTLYATDYELPEDSRKTVHIV
ncbi:hypothetical protein CBER1_06159 [Cercospora berteroae]|uniref:Heterokaryon incompatibility domain-containing protein n=1 Tax=Cercospora berteroae TaxID=357750 RepID=A0A2S6C4E0_9PEZI|nr:hypothetical protein CBER1_06159 [Cercospora berteroae]